MGPLVVAMSAEASDMSSWLLMGLPGVAYLSGVCSAFWTAAGLAIGTWLNWFFVARRLRRYSSNIKAITVPDFLAKRFHDKRNIITAVAALVIVSFYLFFSGINHTQFVDGNIADRLQIYGLQCTFIGLRKAFSQSVWCRLHDSYGAFCSCHRMLHTDGRFQRRLYH